MLIRNAPAAGRGLVVVALLGAAGCGGPPPDPVGRVEGQLTFRGQPVTDATLSFADGKGNGGDAKLAPDGRFVLETPNAELPTGTYTVTVAPGTYLDKSDPRSPPVFLEKKAPNVPERYRRQGSSPLKAVVKEGPNDLALDMTP